MARRLFDHDPKTGITEYWHDGDAEQAVIQSIQDCEDIILYNESMRGHLNRKADWWHIGSIPLATCQKWAQESGTKVFSKSWQEIAKRKINDPDYRKLNPNRIRV